MKKIVVWLLTLGLALGGLPAAAQGGFADVAPGSYYADAVQWAVERGVTSGTSETTFSPGDTCTRGQILTFLWRAAGCLSAEGQTLPEDVPAGAYYEKAVLWGRQQNLFADGPFRPDAPCTRAMAVELMWRAADCPAAAEPAAFADLPASGDIQSAVAWAVEQGITSGTGETTFSPDDTCTRAQIVTLLHRAFGEQEQQKGQQEQNPNQDAQQPALPGRTPVTEIGQMYGTYVGERYTVVVSEAAPTVRIAIYKNSFLAADPNCEPSVTGTLVVVRGEAETLDAAWNGLKITVYQECLVLESPDKLPQMAGVYQRQSAQ